MINVVYSIPVHEDPESYYDMIRNIFYFNKTLNILIIIHCNEFMYEILSKKKIHKVILNPIRCSKKLLSYDVLQAHIDNYMYLFNNNIKLRYFIPYASNCMFYKHVTIEFIERELIEAPEYVKQNYYIELMKYIKVNLKEQYLNHIYLKNVLIFYQIIILDHLLKENGHLMNI